MGLYILCSKDFYCAINYIVEFSAGMYYGGFYGDNKTCSAVIRKSEMTGGAVKNIPAPVRKGYSEVDLAVDDRYVELSNSCVFRCGYYASPA